MTDNELIEAFWVSQGGKPNIKADISFYESSFDMLIPVVGKISDIGINSTIPNAVSMALKVCESPILIKISELHYRCVKFIKWFNDNQL